MNAPLRVAAPDNSPPMPVSGTLIISQSLNSYECLRAELDVVNGRSVVRMSRWKRSPHGQRRTGQYFELGAHHINAVVGMLMEIRQFCELAREVRDARAS